MRRSALLFRSSSSAIDATRFTSTSPSAVPFHIPQNSPPRHSGTQSRIGAGGRDPRGTPLAEAETPTQKVARLRAARAAAKEQLQISTWDKVVVTGRAWVDRLHRVFAVGLIGLTVMAGLVTTYGVVAMIAFNRQKRNAFYADQIRAQQETVIAAIEAEKAGLPMTEEQQLMLNREKARFQAEETRNSKPGFLKRMVAPVTGRRAAEEGDAEREGKISTDGSEGTGAPNRDAVVGEKAERSIQTVSRGDREVAKGLKEMAAENPMSGGKQAEATTRGGVDTAREEIESTADVFAQPVDQWARSTTDTGKRKRDDGFGGWFGR